MELWVRSQDKMNLVKIEQINVSYRNNKQIIANYKVLDSSNDFYQLLGQYKTKERALEVLDEIQKYINNNCKFIEQKTHTKMGTYTNKIDTNVYEMPEE